MRRHDHRDAAFAVHAEERMQEIGAQIEARDDVARVEFTSAAEAWEFYKENFIPEEYSDGFPEGDNPLENSASFEIYMEDISQQDELVSYLESIPEIRTVNQSELAATTLTGVNALVAYVSAGIIVILLLVSIFLISNTVMIGISVRKEEIGIMKYIGATDFFVRAPFVIEGILIGVLGSVLPLAGRMRRIVGMYCSLYRQGSRCCPIFYILYLWVRFLERCSLSSF